MPAALSTDDPPQRTWWNNLAKAPSSKDLRQAYVQEKSPSRPPKPGKLNSFASAIGFKSKKQHSPTLAIQDPPPTLLQYVSPSSSTPPPLPVTRPPSKSISSSRTRVDSIEPRTPIDLQRDHRHSLLTLSDTDPFAPRPVIAVPVPHLPSDPNRLSAYSNPSVTELSQKKHDPQTFNRISYASSSSNSHSHALDIPVTEPLKVVKASERRQLTTKRSIGNIQSNRSEALYRQVSVTPAHSKDDSSSTLVDPHRRSHQESSASPRPKLRTRGMTDSGPSKASGFFVEEQPHPWKVSRKPSSSNIPSPQEASTSMTRVVIRQTSMSRIQPPSAPPTHRLPPPPPSSAPPTLLSTRLPQPDGPTIPQRMGLNCRTSATSSSVTYASSESMPGSPYGVGDKRSSQRSGLLYGHGPEPESPISFVQPKEPTRTLKKALSHQSLTRRGLASPPPTTPPDLSAEKRKQRGFPHPRLPIPPIPLPNIRALPSSANSHVFPASAATPDSGGSSADKRRGSSSATSTSSRRRLFSTSSRPSTSHHAPTTREDDTGSVFSMRSETDSHLTPYKPWINRERQGTSSSSFWDEAGSENAPSSPARSNDYSGPQAIMSRAELAKLEASVDNWSSERSISRGRGYSTLSASTVASDVSRDSDILPGLSPRPAAARLSSKQMHTVPMRMSGAPLGPPGGGGHSRPPSVLSNHDQHHHQQQQQQSQYQPQYQAPYALASAAIHPATRTATPDMISLPPPPRRRKGTMVSEPDVPEDAVAPLSPPASPPMSATMSMTPTPSLMSTMSRAPSTLRSGSMRSKSSAEKNLRRQSIMRKPSFLDIEDDESDQDVVPMNTGGRTVGSDSFLDLARESFDTVRTEL